MQSGNSRLKRRIVHTLVEGHSRHVGARYGLEIEVEEQLGPRQGRPSYEEAVDIQRQLLTHWRVIEDGSLRAGRELVSEPLAGSAVREALQGAYRWIDAYNYGPSVRCGLHVHANMGGKSGPGLADALGAYILAEPYLFAYVGMEREQNIYCVPWYLDPQQYTVAAALCRDLTGGDPTIRMGDIPELSAACKYSALNLLPLFRFHTIEFRHAPCYESAELTFKWFSIVEMLVEKAPWIASRPDPVEAVKSLLSQILSTEQLTRGYALAEEHDVLYRYNVFRKNCVPCTYKPENWGLPAALEAVERGEVVRARKTRLATRRTGNVGGVRLDVPRAPPAARAQRLRTPADIQVAEAPPTLTFATTDEAIYTTANTFADITAAMTARRR